MLETLPLSWSELARRTWREAVDDDVLGLAARLSYYFFLALFPAILFLLALASFFPLSNLTDDLNRSLGPFVSPPVLELIQEQMQRLANNENGGLLTIGVAGGPSFEWAWLVMQWPLVFALVATGIGLIYYFGPDADQNWVWISPGAVAATILWLVISLLFKLSVANFTDYEGSYGAVGGVIVVLLWLYVSGIAILTGAELNAEIEHASPHGKAPGQKNAQGRLLIGARAAQAFRQRQLCVQQSQARS